VGESRGEESDAVNIFSDIHLDPPQDILVTHEVVDDNLIAVISWNQHNDFQDIKGPPMKVKFWDDTERESLALIQEIEIPYGQYEYRTVLGDENIPLDTKFSLQTDFGVMTGSESGQVSLFSASQLSPPNITIISNQSYSLVEWSHTLEVGQFSGLETIVTLWSVNNSIINKTVTTDTVLVFSTQYHHIPQDTLITIQSSVGQYHSNHTDTRPLFSPLALKQSQINRILLIVGLTILLIIYILATIYCLRMVKKKGNYKLKQKHDNFTPGKFSEGEQLLQPLPGKHKPLSEDGSCTTEQESLMSDNSLNITTPYLGESMTTLNKFNDDDDFMGNFDEDGSFIGNYDEYNEEQAQAVQNKLLVFQQMYRANNGAL